MLAKPSISLGVLVEMLEKWASQKKAFSWHACAVAFSGGADSTALLLAACDTAKRHGATQFTAIHVHHGLQKAADDFERQCAATCAALSSDDFTLRFLSERVTINLQAGDSVEQRAREARYAALARAARREGVNTVLLAHHADDQAESLMIALARGAGLAGLAAMAAEFERDGVCFARPLLKAQGALLKAAVAESGLSYVDDPSNTDTRYTRNKFRHELMPAIAAAIPAYRDTFARSARHAAEAQALLENIAEEDFKRVSAYGHISLDKLCGELAALRWPNLLRYWLNTQYGITASTAQLDELCAQIATSQRHGAPRRLRIKVADGFVYRDKDALLFARQE